MFGPRLQEVLTQKDLAIIAYHYMNKICVRLHAKVCSTILQFRSVGLEGGTGRGPGFVNSLRSNRFMTRVNNE